MEKTMVKQLVPLQPMEDPTLQHANVPCRKLQPVETPCYRKLLAGTSAHGEEPTQEQVFWQDL